MTTPVKTISPYEQDIQKIIKALQDLYRSNSEILEGFDGIREDISDLKDAILALNKYHQHLKTFEEQLYKNFIKDQDKPPKKRRPTSPFDI